MIRSQHPSRAAEKGIVRFLCLHIEPEPSEQIKRPAEPAVPMRHRCIRLTDEDELVLAEALQTGGIEAGLMPKAVPLDLKPCSACGQCAGE